MYDCNTDWWLASSNEKFATNNVFFVTEQTSRSTAELGGKEPRQVGAISTVTSVMYVTSELQLLWAVLRLIPVHVKRKPLTSGELPVGWEIIFFKNRSKGKFCSKALFTSIFKENQDSIRNNRIFGFLFVSSSVGSFNSSIVTDIPYWEGIRGFLDPTGHS